MNRPMQNSTAFASSSFESMSGLRRPASPARIDRRPRPAAAMAGNFMGYCGSAAPVYEMSPDVVDLESELGYWRGQYRTLPGSTALRYRDYEPAIKLGLDAYVRSRGRELRDMEEELIACYRRTRGVSRLEWEHARVIVQLAWEHLRSRGTMK